MVKGKCGTGLNKYQCSICYILFPAHCFDREKDMEKKIKFSCSSCGIQEKKNLKSEKKLKKIFKNVKKTKQKTHQNTPICFFFFLP